MNQCLINRSLFLIDPEAPRARVSPRRLGLPALALVLVGLLGLFAPAALAQEAVTLQGRLSVTHAENFETGRHDITYRVEETQARRPGQAARTFRVEFDAMVAVTQHLHEFGGVRVVFHRREHMIIALEIKEIRRTAH